MVSPLHPAGGRFKSLLPAVSRLCGLPLSEIGSIPSETADRDSEVRGDDALLAQIAARDPSVRAAVLREIDRRLPDAAPEDVARLRELLRRLTPSERELPGESEPPPRPPREAFAAAVDVPFARPAEGRGPLRALTGADAPPPAAGRADVELVERVLRASRLVRSRGISRLRLVLDPPELGEVRLDLSLRGQVVHGAFQADAPGAVEALGARLHELKDALERRGLRVGELSVVAEGADPAAPPANPFPAPASLPGNLDVKA